MSTSATAISLSCSQPNAFFLHQAERLNPAECISAQLQSSESRVSVLCANFLKLPQNGTYPAYAPYLPTWEHKSFLIEENQTANCPVNYVMQLVGLFIENITQWINLNVTYSYGEECSNSYKNPPTYLERQLKSANSTFTLGISDEMTSCIPARPKPLEPPHQKLDNYPLAAFAKQDYSAEVEGELCQIYTLEKKSNSSGDFEVLCLNETPDYQNALTSKNEVGDSVTCSPFTSYFGKVNSMATIRYNPSTELGQIKDTSVLINRKTTLCKLPDSSSKDVDIRVAIGAVAGTLLTLVIGFITCKSFRSKKPTYSLFGVSG